MRTQVNMLCITIFKISWQLHVWTESTDNANVNFVKYKGDYYVSTETNYMRRVDPQSLETKEKVSKGQILLECHRWEWRRRGLVTVTTTEMMIVHIQGGVE